MQSMSKLSFFQSQNTFVHFFLQDVSSVFITHQFSHSRGQQSLIGELFMLHFSSICSFFFSIDICFLRIFLRESMSRIVNLWITHELIFDHFHSFQDRLRITFALSNDIDMFGSQIELLLSTLDFSAEFFLVLFLFQFSNFFLVLILFPLFVSKLLFSFFELSSRHI